MQVSGCRRRDREFQRGVVLRDVASVTETIVPEVLAALVLRQDTYPLISRLQRAGPAVSSRSEAGERSGDGYWRNEG